MFITSKFISGNGAVRLFLSCLNLLWRKTLKSTGCQFWAGGFVLLFWSNAVNNMVNTSPQWTRVCTAYSAYSDRKKSKPCALQHIDQFYFLNFPFYSRLKTETTVIFVYKNKLDSAWALHKPFACSNVQKRYNTGYLRTKIFTLPLSDSH